MLISVTANPALDKKARLPALSVGGLNRLSDVRTNCGGKGVNVSLMIQELGGKTIASGFVGGNSGEEFLSRLDLTNVPHDFVRVRGATRTNLKVLDNGGETTELNEPGPVISQDECDLLEHKLAQYADDSAIFALCGSLPRGVPCDFYRKLCGKLRAKGSRVLIDADGDALKAVFDGEAREIPDYSKPNRAELLALFGVSDENSVDDSVLYELAKKVCAKGVRVCGVSLGGDGALFVSNEGARRFSAVSVQSNGAVGAGDCFAGAFLYGIDQGFSLERCYALGVAAGTGLVASGSVPPKRDFVEKLLENLVCEVYA